MTSACFSRGHTGFSRNATLVATVNPPALAGGVFNIRMSAWDGGEKVDFFAIAMVKIFLLRL